MQLEQQEDCIKLYNASFSSPDTGTMYLYHLKKYCKTNPTILTNSIVTQKEAEDTLISYIITNKEQGASWCQLHMLIAAVCRFYSVVRDLELNRKRIKRFMPERIRQRRDRHYTYEEIQKLLELADERGRVIILLLASTGMRIGALPTLKVSDLIDTSGGELYKLLVHSNTNDEYVTFCTLNVKLPFNPIFK